MKRVLVVLAAAFMCGCVNVYTRCPGSPGRIVDTYQSTKVASAFTVVASFPQMVGMSGDVSLAWENVFTVPFFGLPCAVDTCLEAVVDTVFWPFDSATATYRARHRTAVGGPVEKGPAENEGDSL